jgi:hypothetical protein
VLVCVDIVHGFHGFHGLQVAAMAVAMAALLVEEPGGTWATGQVIAQTTVSLGDVVAAPALWSLAGARALKTIGAAGDAVWLCTLQIVLICASTVYLAPHPWMMRTMLLVVVGVVHGLQGIQLAPMGHRHNGHEYQDDSQGVEPLQSQTKCRGDGNSSHVGKAVSH